ncbi:MAG TPA: acyl carrier protein [Pyrinomonadaceae bacterium]|jgi:acyl carrier protein
MSNNAQAELSYTAIREWLVVKVAELLAVEPAKLDVHEPFANYGLSSMTGVILSGDIEHWLGLRLSPTLAWEYPTIDSLTRYLTAELKLPADPARDASQTT